MVFQQFAKLPLLAKGHVGSNPTLSAKKFFDN